MSSAFRALVPGTDKRKSASVLAGLSGVPLRMFIQALQARTIHDRFSAMLLPSVTFALAVPVFKKIWLVNVPCGPMEHRAPVLRVTSNRTHCPHCGSALREPIFKEGVKRRGIVSCQIIAEPKTVQAFHISRWCESNCQGKGTKYWCGFSEKPLEVRSRKRRVPRKAVDEPHAEYFFLNKSWGVAHTWLRRWQYRMFLHRASFLGEGVLLRLLDPSVQVKVRQNLSAAWAREILWRRAGEIGGATQEDLAKKLLSWPLEKLVESCWSWHEAHMFQRPGFMVSMTQVIGPKPCNVIRITLEPF